MKKSYSSFFSKLMLSLVAIFCINMGALAATEVHVDKAGTLSTLLTTSESTLKITGSINGTDVKYLLELIKAGTVTNLDISEVAIVKGGSAYFENYTTDDDVIGHSMFKECKNLKTIELPATIYSIQANAFSGSGLRKIDIPNSVSSLGGDAFAYCSSLDSVTMGRRVTSLGQGVFYASSVKFAYIKPITPPGAPAYLFSSNPKIMVYTDALEDYKQSGWKSYYGSIVGGLEDIFPLEDDPAVIVNNLRETYFEDAACTQLKAEYLAMSDEELTAAMTDGGMPAFMTEIAVKLKNENWGKFEKDFRIHSYKAYSDANYWNEKLKSTGGSYMGNPTGIYAGNLEPLYVFVDSDIPTDATLYIAGCIGNHLISNAKTGKQLKKGLNIVEGDKNALYYILYTADTESQTKTLDEWPEIKIHIQGGTVNGYYDVARKSDSEYKALLNAATHELFTVKSEHALFNFQTDAYKEVWPKTIDRSIEWFDSLTVWQQELMGYTATVANGQRNYYPHNLTGGEAIAPLFYNNPNFAVQGDANSAGYANSSTYRTMYNSVECIRNSFDVSRSNMDEWCAGHECGHNNQGTINLEACGEASNNLFSNVCRFIFGRNMTGGNSLSYVMNEYANSTYFSSRDLNSRLRMYYQLYLYFHQAKKNTSFYPELFKALREDPLKLYSNSSNGKNGSLKFVRKVCEVAQEDLSDFFRAWGFFEPVKNLKIEDYGNYTLTVTQTQINNTLKEISKYPKNRTILFVEDRVKEVLTNDLFQTAGKLRSGYDKLGEYGNLGQFTDYMIEDAEPSSYTYIQSDSLYSMAGTGGIGFLMLDKDSNFVYAANSLNFCIPSSITTEFTIYSVDADGTLHEVEKSGEGTQYVTLTTAGTLSDSLTTDAIKAIISGPINGYDIKYLRKLINEYNLSSIDLSGATIKSGGAYYNSYKSIANGIGEYTFYECNKLTSIILPNSITSIRANAFSNSGLTGAFIPDGVTAVGGDAFAYSKSLKIVTIGSSVKSLSQGVFYSSPVKDAYVYATTPPSVSAYLFSSNPVIHVYASSLAAYKASDWAQYGTIVGDLDNYTAIEPITPDADSNDANAPIYDMMGRKVTNMQPGKIYIRGGKKFIAK
ncbi:MAG: leucine-rich repeat protein [Bacteroidaceae bacterium]|nr:leucine-rich repeat protein [Bacteroidaceae bacterium]